MKKLIALLITMLIVVSSCAAERYVSISSPDREISIVEVLCEQHPELVPYYEEGVLKITSMREIRTEMGYSYDIRYKFVKRYLYDAERYLCLKEHYPELYELYLHGAISIRSVYKYVDSDGIIKYHVSYNRLYDYYYESVPYPYGGYRYHYRLRPVPPRVKPAPAPRPGGNNPPPPQARPNDNPRPRPEGNVRPNNPPRQNGGQQARPNNQPQSRPNSTPNVRPNNSQPRQSNPQVTRPNNSNQSRPNTPQRSNSGNGGNGGGRRGR